MRKSFAEAMVGALALVGFAHAAHASATVDLIWIDTSSQFPRAPPICLMPANRNCRVDPRSVGIPGFPDGVAISSTIFSDNMTLALILTPGPNASWGAGVSVNYGDTLPQLSVVGFQSLTTTKPFAYLPLSSGTATDQPPYIDHINALADPPTGFGIGLPPGDTAYLGTVMFHKDVTLAGTYEIRVGTDGPGGMDYVLDGFGNDISATAAFNSAYLIANPTPTATPPTPTPTATPTATPIPTSTSTPTATPTAEPPPLPGPVVGWGGNSYGQATPPDGVNGVAGIATHIAAGRFHSCAIQAGTEEVVCWGSDGSGQSTPPDAVNGVAGTAADVAAGYTHSCAAQADTGNVVCWGNNYLGQVVPPDAINGVAGTATHVAAGYFHSCAIQAVTGNVVCWGGNFFGEATPPDAVNGTSGTATDIAVGNYLSCAIQAGTRKAVCWGRNADGQATPPDAVNGTSGTATDIAAGEIHSCAIQAGAGAVVCWGQDSFITRAPDAVNGTSGTATDIATGEFHSCAIRADTRSVICWGRNSDGRASPPGAVNGVSGTARAIAAGDFHSLAIAAALEPTPTPTPTATPTATPTPGCEDLWPVTSIVTIAKGQSAAHNAKVSHQIVGNIVEPTAVCPGDGPCTAHRIPVCAGTEVHVAVTGAASNANVGRGVISCDAGGCFVDAIDTAEKYKSVSADGKDTDRVTLLPQ